ncbi:MAG: hypothetical protein L3K07_01855 [Thermoplasmata archaeon]|nr:hypothetical protein [Thermoplasmata archaeon]
MSVRLQSADDGAVRPAPIEIVEITRQKSMKVVLYRGQNVESSEEATPASGEVGMKLKGMQWSELKPGDLLLG